jgi:predicted RNase H-like nuclease
MAKSLAVRCHDRTVGAQGTVSVLGVDGRRGDWAVALATGTPRRARVRWCTVKGPGVAGVLELARAEGVAAVGFDVPVGLPDDDWRVADRAAKRELGAAHARVFLTPPRAVLAAADYATARRVCREVLRGKGLSAQTWGLRGPVLALDAALATDPWARAHVVETHPEVSFAQLAGRVLPSKKTAEGRQDRLDALAAWADVRDVPPGDDHLDATVCAWSALRWAAGLARVLGGAPDERGLPQRIVV